MPNPTRLLLTTGTAGVTGFVTGGPKGALVASSVALIGQLMGSKEPVSNFTPVSLNLESDPKQFKVYGDTVLGGSVIWAGTRRLERTEAQRVQASIDRDVTLLSIVVSLGKGEVSDLLGVKVGDTYVQLHRPLGSKPERLFPSYRESYVHNLFVETSFAQPGIPELLKQYYPYVFEFQSGGAPAYSFLHLGILYDEKLFSAGLPDISFRVRGVRVRDLSNFSNPNAKRWTNNAVSVIKDVYDDPIFFRYQGEFDPYNLLKSYNIANRILDNDTRLYEQVSGSLGGLTYGDNHTWKFRDFPTKSYQYTYDGVVSTEDDFEQIHRDLSGAINGHIVQNGPRMLVFPGANIERGVETPTLHEDDFLEGAKNIRVQSQLPEGDLFNVVRLELEQSQPHNFQTLALEFADTSAIARDGGRRVKTAEGVKGINNPFNARRMQSQILHSAGFALTVRGALSDPKYKTLKYGDGVFFTSPYYELDRLPMKVISIEAHKTEPTNIILKWSPPNEYRASFDVPHIVNLPFPSVPITEPTNVSVMTNRDFSLKQEILEAVFAWKSSSSAVQTEIFLKKSSAVTWSVRFVCQRT